MNDSKTILSTEEARKIMQRKIVPIIMQNRVKDKNGIFYKPDKSSFILSIFITVAVLILNFTQALALNNIHDVYKPTEITSNQFTYKKSNIENGITLNSVNKQGKKYFKLENDIQEKLGDNKIKVNNKSLIKYDLPNSYYDNIDFSSFQPFMCYTLITDNSSSAWKVVNSKKSYTDNYGFRRYKPDKNKFMINNQDDYIVALGTFYKTKGVCGLRYLIVTNTGMYTAITGDEKSDSHTDSMGMFSSHGNGKSGLIEWIVDQDSGKIPNEILKTGTVTSGPVKALQGKIKYIYKIE